MPTRRLPRYNQERHDAMRQAKERKDAVPPPLIIPFTANTILRLDTLQPVYKTKYQAVSTAKNAQTAISVIVNDTKELAVFHIQDFIVNLNNGIRRKLILPTARNLYNIPVNDTNLPYLGSENDIVTWGENIDAGETARIAAGGVPITFPSLAQVNTAVNNFKAANQLQANAKDAYDAAQEVVEADNPEADKLILKMWNEIETAFDEGNKPSMRRKCREWGVVYVLTPGEEPSPEEFSMMGTITDSVTGLPVSNAAVVVQSPEIIVTTDALGKYFVPLRPAGTVTIFVHKDGYVDQTTGGITITEGAITVFDMQLSPGVTPETGTITGTVTKAGAPALANVTVDGLAGGVVTNPGGNYTLESIPEGPQTIRATLTANPIEVLTQNITVIAGETVTVNFVFP